MIVETNGPTSGYVSVGIKGIGSWFGMVESAVVRALASEKHGLPHLSEAGDL